ncbi:MAG: enoyl-CoA hydratase/isomerase family protein, partial [Pseudacidovorax sp.]|nr:enoyl-CoA hydratase/isomerase family protein [Pseudacidovorax sp.]
MTSTPATPADAVRHQIQGEILQITVDNPPVNALSAAVRRGLLAAIEAADAEPRVKAVLIVGQGANFIAGADIREFGQTPQPPSLPEVCNRIEACSKPVVAALRGAALGGGLEIAMAAHYRVALADAKLGLPEVQLGLMPGAGGTVRAPRLIGAEPALELMLSGRHIKAKEALSLGLVDRLAEGDDAVAAGLAYAQALLAADASVRRTRDAQGLADRAAAQAAIDAAKAET